MSKTQETKKMSSSNKASIIIGSIIVFLIIVFCFYPVFQRHKIQEQVNDFNITSINITNVKR